MNSPMHRFVRKLVSFLVQYKKTVVATAVVILSVSVFGMTKVKNLFFPDFDYNQFVVECFFPSETSADAVRDHLMEMSEMLEKEP